MVATDHCGLPDHELCAVLFEIVQVDMIPMGRDDSAEGPISSFWSVLGYHQAALRIAHWWPFRFVCSLEFVGIEIRPSSMYRLKAITDH